MGQDQDPSAARPGTRKIAGVIFDMDGVLVDSEPFIAEAAVRMFAEKGVAVRPDDFRPFIGTGEDRFLGGVAEARGVALEMPRDKDRTYEIYLELIRGRLKPLPGVAKFIGRCRTLGLKLAVASSADRVKVEGNLRELGLPPEHLRRRGRRRGHHPQEARPGYFPGSCPPLGIGAEHLPGDRRRRLRRRRRQGRRQPLPGADHVVLRRSTHRGRGRLDGGRPGEAPHEVLNVVNGLGPDQSVTSGNT